MRRLPETAVIIVLFSLLGGCTTHNFMIYKDGSNFYISRDCTMRHKLLCDSGDIDRIVASSDLPTSLQLRIKAAICSAERGKNDMRDILEEMTDEQLTALKNALGKFEYEINKPVDT